MADPIIWGGHELVKRPPRHVWKEIDGELVRIEVDGLVDYSYADEPPAWPEKSNATPDNLLRYECVECGKAFQGWGPLVRWKFDLAGCEANPRTDYRGK